MLAPAHLLNLDLIINWHQICKLPEPSLVGSAPLSVPAKAAKNTNVLLPRVVGAMEVAMALASVMACETCVEEGWGAGRHTLSSEN
jgi:hypothetical protein